MEEEHSPEIIFVISSGVAFLSKILPCSENLNRKKTNASTFCSVLIHVNLCCILKTLYTC